MDIRDVVAGKYTKQEIFDFVVEKLRAQGCLGWNVVSNTCAYRGSNGTKCAIGHMISDERYSPLMEGFDFQQLVGDGFVPACPADWSDFLTDIQGDLHDGLGPLHFLARFERRASDFADVNNLTYTPPPSENP